MTISKTRLLGFMTSSVLALGLAVGPTIQPAAASIWSWKAHACRGAVYVTVELDNNRDQPPIVSYSFRNQSDQLNVTFKTDQLTGQDHHSVYQYFGSINPQMADNAVGQINIDGGNAGAFTIDGGPCPVLGRIAGTAFIDTNQNGIWDKGEPTFGAAWMKVTGGGSWFVCGWM